MKTNTTPLDTFTAQCSEPLNSTAQNPMHQLVHNLVQKQGTVMLDINHKLRELKLSYQYYHLLCYLKKQKPRSMRHLAKKMSVTTAAGTGMIDRLEGMGLVQRTHDPLDRRKVRVRITKCGIETVENIQSEMVPLLLETITEDIIDSNQPSQNSVQQQPLVLD